MLFGYFFIILGIFLLLKAMGVIIGDFWGYFWGILFLTVGFSMVTKTRSNTWCWLCSHKKERHNRDDGQI